MIKLIYISMEGGLEAITVKCKSFKRAGGVCFIELKKKKQMVPINQLVYIEAENTIITGTVYACKGHKLSVTIHDEKEIS